MQRKKLEDLKPKEYIKRKGDVNLIIPGKKTIVINSKGWVLEYNQKPKYHENKIFNMEVNLRNSDINNNNNIKESSDIAGVEFKVDDEVTIEY